ncbi:MAG TPA: galactose-1-phosphate uridylyltransferase [Deltaproteobacteria bacterium]|nr:galactose-1-phosphate uridylyltransferase [Deltaproteobacteria bacterium]HQI80638.1 galactose-1-phosphate uridylyltransferase [Deltaproteobacteria bacterium]
MSELRKDPVVERWVLVADDALRSPVIPRSRDRIDGGLLCPFCPGNEHLCPPDIFANAPNGFVSVHAGWQLRVIPNRSPLLMVEEGHRRSGEGLYDKITGVGANEVFIETPEHGIRQSQMSPAQLECLIWAYQSRIHDLRKDGRIRSVYIYKNCGVQAGATLDHGYSLLVALPIAPRAVAEEVEGARRHFLIKERCIYCDVIHQETAAETRLVAESTCFIAIEPFAPRVPFETWILPRRHAPRFEHIEPAEVHDLALIFREVMSRIDAGLCSPDYNYWIHSAAFGNECDPYYHWHMEILPRIAPPTGLEGGTDLYYNTTLPEDAAEYLRRLVIP